jgi:membrane protein DedA with SNARE-associated domain
MDSLLSSAGVAEWLSTWGYLGVFACVFMGNLGISLPEETILLVAGFLAGRHVLELRTLYAVGIVSAVTGDCSGFLLGRTGGRRLFERLGQKFQFVRRRYDHVQTFFRVHGSKAVFIARFFAGARLLAGPMAGVAGMRFWRFLGWNLLGACIWCPVIISVGYFLGDELNWLIHLAHGANYCLAAVFFALALTAAIWWRYRHRVDTEA